LEVFALGNFAGRVLGRTVSGRGQSDSKLTGVGKLSRASISVGKGDIGEASAGYGRTGSGDSKPPAGV
jgi:hypothetical protein